MTVQARKLRYAWEWAIEDRDLPNPRENRGMTRTVRASPRERPREKGVDLAIALDVVTLAVSGRLDVAIIVSSDTDMSGVPHAVRQLTKNAVRVEAATFSDSRPQTLSRYAHTHTLRGDDFEAARDRFRYREKLARDEVSAFTAACESGLTDVRSLRP